METRKNSRNGRITKSVLILPMRNGNTVMEEKMSKERKVLILPMRNGNATILLILLIIFITGSYPTYEEWKHV